MSSAGATEDLDDDVTPPPPPPPDLPAKPKRGKGRILAKIALGLLVAVLWVSAGGLGTYWVLTDRYEGMVAKEDILSDVPMAPPPPAGESAPLNYLILGSDTRAGDPVTGPEATGSRSDTIMIAHVSKDRKNAFIFSIPRDSYVNVPPGGNWHGGNNKINAAMSFGGANLAAKTVYDLTRIPLNGAVIVNFQGIQTMVSAVGGVRVCIPYTVRSSFTSKVWKKGCHDLSPKDAEEFVRQRKGTPGGDLGRIKNQQHVVKGLIAKVKADGLLTSPAKLDGLMTTAAKSLTLDKSMNLTQLALEVKDIDQENIKFATTPITGTMTTDAGSSVGLDLPACEELFAAVRDDKTDQWLTAHPQPEVASI
ncbi:MAG TPA: LCP family protein [Candidatus Limnocylindrales bacterium]|nr:LCP family protein [Candidatus Limnocylindrales bacterium]